MDRKHVTMRVAALAAEVGVSPDTVRYYERVGLLPVAPRTPTNHRLYDWRAVDRLRFIQGAQRLGLRLMEIRPLLDLRDTGECPCDAVATLLEVRLADIDREIDQLSQLRSELAAFLSRIPAPDCPDPEPGTWRPREEVAS